MRLDHVRLGVLAVVTAFVSPCSAVAQTATSTDAAIEELRQLLADQRAVLDRQARLIVDNHNGTSNRGPKAANQKRARHCLENPPDAPPLGRIETTVAVGQTFLILAQGFHRVEP